MPHPAMRQPEPKSSILQQQKLIAGILRASARITATRNTLLAGWGMTGARLRVLKTIHRIPVPFSVAGLARVMGITRQTLHPMIRELEGAGLILVTMRARNRRVPLIALTTLGKARLEEVVRVERRWLLGLTRGFDDRLLAQTAWVLRIVRDRSSD
jgi:DNA-binding MarR family transcriptional regulator